MAFDIKAIERDRVLAAAEKYLSDSPVTVTAFSCPRSAGGIHDYFSEGNYWWPDPADPEGPYVRRDGMTNPNLFEKHREAMWGLSARVPCLVAAYLISGEEEYSKHAIEWLRAWFVEPATRMNPHLLYGQAIHGRVTGRGIGIIDTLHLVEVARAVVVLRAHRAIDPADDAAVTAWFGEYLTWLTTHQYGIDEGDYFNNHATGYWLQVAQFARVTGNEAALAESRRRYKVQLLPQMAPDGSFPEELARTRPYAYSIFNLDQMVMLCEVASTAEDDLWHYALPTGQSIGRAVEFMAPFIEDKSRWKLKPDVMYWEYLPVRSPSLLFAGLRLSVPKYVELWKRLGSSSQHAEMVRMVEIRQAALWVE